MIFSNPHPYISYRSTYAPAGRHSKRRTLIRIYAIAYREFSACPNNSFDWMFCIGIASRVDNCISCNYHILLHATGYKACNEEK